MFRWRCGILSCGEGEGGGAGLRGLGRRREGGCCIVVVVVVGKGGSGGERVMPSKVWERSIGVEAVRSIKGGVGWFVRD